MLNKYRTMTDKEKERFWFLAPFGMAAWGISSFGLVEIAYFGDWFGLIHILIVGPIGLLLAWRLAWWIIP